MSISFKVLGLVGLLLTSSLPAFAKVNVFACEPEWASLVLEVGGDKVKIKSAIGPKQDPHYLRAKPSLLSAMRKADLVVCSGADLEIGWLPILLSKAGKASVQEGRDGYLMAADYVNVLDKPRLLDRSQGDVHALGNPHVHLNPHNLRFIAKEVKNRLVILDAGNSIYYSNQLSSFLMRLDKAIEGWEKRITSWKGKEVVTHHKSWTYLIDWTGLKQVAILEDKSGVSPTLKHLNSVLNTVHKSKVFLIMRSPYDSDDASIWLSKKTGVRAQELPFTIDKSVGIKSLFDLYGAILNQIEKAM